ncbi:MAG TPA: serine protease, partial [Candidatus Obscuribacterales bacterium]
TVVGHPEGFPAMVVSQGTMIKRQIVADGPGPTADENPNNVILRADIHIRGGNSGGPFLNDKGEVVGVVNFREYYSRGQFMPVEDLRAMIKDENGKALGDPRSHIIPASLHFGSHTQMVGSSGLLGVTSGLSHAYLKMNPASKIAAYGRLPGYMMLTAVGAADMPGDYRFFENAMANGSTAERISAGINLGGDAAMTGGAALGMLSRLKKAGLAVALLGVGAKLANDVLADRDMS